MPVPKPIPALDKALNPLKASGTAVTKPIEHLAKTIQKPKLLKPKPINVFSNKPLDATKLGQYIRTLAFTKTASFFGIKLAEDIPINLDRLSNTGMFVGMGVGTPVGARLGGIVGDFSGATSDKAKLTAMGLGALAGMGLGGWLGRSSARHLGEDIYMDMHPELYPKEELDKYITRHLELEHKNLEFDKAAGYTQEQINAGLLAATPMVGGVAGPAYSAVHAPRGEELAAGLATYGAGQLGTVGGIAGGGLLGGAAGMGIGAALGKDLSTSALYGALAGGTVGGMVGRGIGTAKGLQVVQDVPEIKDTDKEEGGATEQSVALASLLPGGAPVAAGLGAPPGSKLYRALTTLGGVSAGAALGAFPGLLMKYVVPGKLEGKTIPFTDVSLAPLGESMSDVGSVLAAGGSIIGGGYGAAKGLRAAKAMQEARAARGLDERRVTRLNAEIRKLKNQVAEQD